MLNGGRDDGGFLAADETGKGLERGAIRLCSAGGEDDLIRVSIDEGRNLLAGGGDGRLDWLGCAITGRWVVELLSEKREHGLQDFRVHGSGGVVVEVDHLGSEIFCKERSREKVRDIATMKRRERGGCSEEEYLIHESH